MPARASVHVMLAALSESRISGFRGFFSGRFLLFIKKQYIVVPITQSNKRLLEF